MTLYVWEAKLLNIILIHESRLMQLKKYKIYPKILLIPLSISYHFLKIVVSKKKMKLDIYGEMMEKEKYTLEKETELFSPIYAVCLEI